MSSCFVVAINLAQYWVNEDIRIFRLYAQRQESKLKIIFKLETKITIPEQNIKRKRKINKYYFPNFD